MHRARGVLHGRRHRLFHLRRRKLILGVEVGIDLIDLALLRRRYVVSGQAERETESERRHRRHALAEPCPTHNPLPIPDTFKTIPRMRRVNTNSAASLAV